MVIATSPMTVEEFDSFVLMPENADRMFEYIGGEIVEVVSNNYSSEIGASFLVEIGGFVKKNRLGRVTGADGGYRIAGERYIPDVAFISKARQPEPSHEAYNPNPPDLVVEVTSASKSGRDLRFKVVNYWQIGTTVWVVDPINKRVEVYVPNQSPLKVGIDGELDVGTVLPGFKLPLRDIFPE